MFIKKMKKSLQDKMFYIQQCTAKVHIFKWKMNTLIRLWKWVPVYMWDKASNEYLYSKVGKQLLKFGGYMYIGEK